ncbi:adhesion G protein-coupled receptor G3 isoform X1 [Cyanistes caeruleus]|uniref:adhesion G protein-coupled receptor G3 isoform X1 n=1 Tax=Cyanistes caeruleus TaxID=156563 RepID=UPI000CDAB079|nr:adhesion G protein-coupled receptor G3 isoform X1 [Cyanistes caeruleus]XP_023790344.1 adhesion G protein-coupled receptor G3 isoform X1 [Cyanistes caeruleus]
MEEQPGTSTRIPHLSQHCPELWHSESRACACLRERWFRLLQSGLAGLKTLLLNVSRAVTRDVLITFSPTAVRCAPPSPLLGRLHTFQASFSSCPRAWCALLCPSSSPLDVPGDHVWVMEGRESASSHSKLCPHRCWLLGMRFFPSALRAPADVAEPTHLGKAEFVPGARLVSSEQKCDLAATTSHSSSLLQGPSRLNTTEKGKTGKIHLPREIFRSLSSQTVRVVVTVLNIQQLGMFKEVNQTAQVLDNTVVGITVGESSISGLQDPVQLTFTHGELPQGVTPQCVFWDASKGRAGGWGSSGCVTQPGDKRTVCSCDHLTFFTLLLNPALDGSTAKALMAVATAGCAVAMAFSIFTMAFCIFIRYRFRFEETVRINLGLHVNLVGSLFLLNLAFLLNTGLSGRTHPSSCRVLGGVTHYCLLCCFTWTALEGCQLYLLFVKVLGTYIPRYLAKLSLLGWGLPVLVVGVAGVIGTYGEYSIQTTDQQVVAHLCWITSKHLLVHYITNCGYFGLIFLFNMAVFGVVTQKSCSLQGTGAVQGYHKPWKVALVAAGLFCLLGATWALAFLTYGISSTPVLYLFTVLNSLQGIFIFIWLVVLYYPKTKQATGSLSNIIRHDKTTTASQD